MPQFHYLRIAGSMHHRANITAIVHALADHEIAVAESGTNTDGAECAGCAVARSYVPDGGIDESATFFIIEQDPNFTPDHDQPPLLDDLPLDWS